MGPNDGPEVFGPYVGPERGARCATQACIACKCPSQLFRLPFPRTRWSYRHRFRSNRTREQERRGKRDPVRLRTPSYWRGGICLPSHPASRRAAGDDNSHLTRPPPSPFSSSSLQVPTPLYMCAPCVGAYINISVHRGKR